MVIQAWWFAYFYKTKGDYKILFSTPPTVQHSAQKGSGPPLSTGSSFRWTPAWSRIPSLFSDPAAEVSQSAAAAPFASPDRTALAEQETHAGVPLPQPRPGHTTSAVNTRFSDPLVQSHNCCCMRLVQEHRSGEKVTLAINRAQFPAAAGSYTTESLHVCIKFHLPYGPCLAAGIRGTTSTWCWGTRASPSSGEALAAPHAQLQPGEAHIDQWAPPLETHICSSPNHPAPFLSLPWVPPLNIPL